MAKQDDRSPPEVGQEFTHVFPDAGELLTNDVIRRLRGMSRLSIAAATAVCFALTLVVPLGCKAQTQPASHAASQPWKGGVLCGRTVLEGRPMPGVDVNVWAAGDVQLLDHAVTDDDGQFEVTGLPEGVNLDVVASKLRGDYWLLQKQSRATVVPGRPCEMGDIHLGAMPPPISNPDTPEFYPRSQAARLSSAPASH